MVKRSLSELDVAGKRVLVRVDFNVPIEQGIEAIASYDQRLRATLPTIEYLIGQGSRTLLCSHLGRPNGQVVESLRLAPVGDRLAKLLDRPVKSLPDVSGPAVDAVVAADGPRRRCLAGESQVRPRRGAKQSGVCPRAGRSGGAVRDGRLRRFPPCSCLYGGGNPVPAVGNGLLGRE